jgi:hypothetical protein
MSSGAVRDRVADHLVTPQNAALVVIGGAMQQLGGPLASVNLIQLPLAT